ncbi:MAG: leucine-rich repeat protein [Oscillospiraceae bacterium]|nr:leucine-rich repeat protein [Oscillospiraceae bacterium]
MKGKKILSISIATACLLMNTPTAVFAVDRGAPAQTSVAACTAVKATAPTTAEPYTLTAEDVAVELCREDESSYDSPFVDAVKIVGWKSGVDVSQEKYKNIVIPETLSMEKTTTDADGKAVTETVDMPVVSAYLNPGETAHGNLEKVTVGKNVRFLGDFSGCENLSEVVIPEDSALEAFGDKTFYNTVISGLFIPAGVTELPANMCYGCKNLTTVTFAEGSKLTKIGESAFTESGLTSIELPDTVTKLGANVFTNCKLAEIALPDALAEIPQYTFAYCTSLSKVTFGSGLTSIGDFAFQDTAIEELVIPDSVVFIGRGAFNNIEALRSVSIGKGLKELGGCIDLNDDGVICVPCFQNDVNIETLELSEGLEKIGDEMFKWSGKIEPLVIPSTVKHIGRAAFGGFNGIGGSEVHALSELTFAENSQLENIFQYAFCNSSIKHLTLPIAAKPFKIWDDAFDSSKELLDADLGNCQQLGSATAYTSEDYYHTDAAIGGAFASCTRLRSVKLSDNLEIINHGSFSECISLTGPIAFPSTLKTIGHGAFNGCSMIEDVTFNEGLEVIGNAAFCGCDLHEISLPDTVTTVGDRCFEGNAHVEKIRFSAGMTVIPNRFLDCYAEDTAAYSLSNGSHTDVGRHGVLKELVIPENIKEIGVDAFDGCLDLEYLDLGQVEYIGKGAFSCHDMLTAETGRLGSLKTVVMSPALKEIGTLPPNCPEMESAFADVFHGQGAFDGLELPATLEKVSDYAFADCQALKEVTISENLKSVGKEAFTNCPNLTKVVFADAAATKFDDGAFTNCKGLTEITLPAWLESIPAQMFNGCRNLADVTFSEGMQEIGGMAFANTGLRSVELPESCLTIGEAAFQNAPIGNVKLGSKTVSIGADAFVQDTNLHLMPSVYVPDSVKAIGERAFGYYKDTDKNYEDLCAEAERREAETGEHVDVQSLMAPTIANHDFILYGGKAAKRYAEENDMVYGGAEQPEQPAVVTGELNGDGTVNASDAAVILIAAAAIGAGQDSGLTEAQKTAADVNGDGICNASDAAIVLIYAAAVGAGQDVKLTDFVK